MICEHRVLTTGQLTQLAFGTTRAATARMTTLYQYRAVDRFRPLAAAGSSPLHFILDEAGAMLLAAEDAITPADLGYRRDRSMAIALSPRLAHDTGANGIFTALAAAARASGGAQALERWWGERRCAATWGGHARPDGYGRWSGQLPGGPAAVTDFFLEYDTGTEPLSRVTAKLAGYAALAARTAITTPVLFWLRSPGREAALHARLAHNTGANGIFTTLAAAARASGGQQALECWWGERRCAATWGGQARPDGYGRWAEQLPGRPAATVDFFLEYDTGTEPLSRVVAKLAGYAALAARTGITTPVLFHLRSPSREAALHARLAGPPPPGIPAAASAAQIPGVPVATATPTSSPQGPAGAAWLPAGTPGPRLRLAQLAPPGIAPDGNGPDDGEQDGPPGGLPWHPPSPAPPAWNAAADEPRPGQDDDD